MARITYGSLVTDIAGSIGGSTFQRSQYGNTLRNKPNPTRSTSPAQLLIRQYMKKAHDAWLDMTPAERLQWQQFTTYSNPKIKHDRHVTMSGHNLYLKYQVSRLLAGLSIQDTLTYIPMPTWYYPSLIYKDDPLLYLDTDAPPETTFEDLFIIFLVSSPRRATLKYQPHGLRLCKCSGADWDSLIFNVDYVAAFGALPVYTDILHYSYQVFSTETPIFSNIRTGTLVITPL
jgi:hypothetical protein